MDNNIRSDEILARQTIENLYREHSENILVYIKSIISQLGPLNYIDAEDLLQETFLRGFLHFIAKGDDVNHPKAWLKTTAKNCYIQHKKEQSNSLGQAISLSLTIDRAHVEEVEASNDPEEASLTREQITEPMEALSPKRRQLVDLINQGYTTKEAARILGQQSSSARSTLSRSRKIMREVISNE